MDDYDNPWKEILDSFFESFVEFFFPRAYNEIDWSRGFESLDTELRQIVREAENRRRTVDKLVKVWLKSGQAEWILVHIEVQTRAVYQAISTASSIDELRQAVVEARALQNGVH